MSTNILMSKTYASEVISDYAEIVEEEDDDDDAIELAYFAPILKERENEISVLLEDFISQYYAEK